MSRKNRDFFREKSEFLRDRLLLLFIDIARRGLLIAYDLNLNQNLVDYARQKNNLSRYR